MTVLITRVFRDAIHEKMAEALTDNVAHRLQEVDDSGMTEFISVEDAISITAAVLHSLTSDSADCVAAGEMPTSADEVKA